MELPDLTTPTAAADDLESEEFPNKGVGVSSGCDSSAQLSTTGVSSFPRVNSFSACRAGNNTAFVAVSSLRPDILALDPTDDAHEAARRLASRVYILPAELGNYYASSARLARVVAVGTSLGPDAPVGVDVRVDRDIQADTNMNFVWTLDGNFPSRKLHIGDRLDDDTWRLSSADNTSLVDVAQVGDCFHFIAFCPSNCPDYAILSEFSPLPYILVDGLAVPSINPQIAANANGGTIDPVNLYVIAEAPVNGVHQLFFYSLQVVPGSAEESQVFGWKQLTFDGENRNARLSVDPSGNLHMVWESSRCATGQVMYGILGPSSRAVINEVFASAVDKQVAADKLVEAGEAPAMRLSTSLVDISDPVALNLRARDVDGIPTGSFWTDFKTGGGNVTVTDDGTITVTGNPSTDKFAAFAALRRDEFDVLFDGEFSQLSFQIAFDLNPSSGDISVLDEDEIGDIIADYRNLFTPTIGSSGANFYRKGGVEYTIGDPIRLYENLIPIAGSYKASGLVGNATYDTTHILEQLELRHLMLAIVPEKLRLVATSLSGSVYQEEYYTGKFKLALVTETSADIEFRTLADQRHHWVRLFGDELTFGENNSYKLAIHYSKLRDEHVFSRQRKQTMDVPEQDVRFSANVIVAINDEVQVAETFIPKFEDQYRQFDIGIGSTFIGEYRSPNITAREGSVNADVDMALTYTRVAVGLHTVTANDYLTTFGNADRNVSRMVVKSDADELDSMGAFDETWQTDEGYQLNLGLNRSKVKLGQIPITFLGRNTNPAIATDACDRAHIAYQSNRDGNWEIYYCGGVTPNLPFRFDTRITEHEGNSLMPTIGVDDKGRRLIAWHDNRDGNYQIYAARSTADLSCDEGLCERDDLASEYGLEPVTNYLVGGSAEYVDAYDASVCQLRFVFQNQGVGTKTYHFRANFYYNGELTSFYKYIDSRYDIANWSYEVDGQEYAFPYAGVTVAAGASVEVKYNVGSNDELNDQVYHVEVQADDGTTVAALARPLVFFCPLEQLPKCSVPCLYTNETGGGQSVHFRVDIFRDEAMAELVMSSLSSATIGWRAGGNTSFPSGGLTVAAGDTVNATFDPDFLPLEESLAQQQATVDSLLCNTRYWVRVTSIVGITQTEQDEFALVCSCDAVRGDVWRNDTTSRDWLCSGQGSSDIRITQTRDHALFASAYGSADGMVYLAWEDHRFTEGAIAPYAYWGAWDAVNDIFYCSAQGYRDRLAGQAAFRPVLLVSNMQYPSVVWQNDTGIFKRVCSLYRAPVSEAEFEEEDVVSLFDEEEIPYDANDPCIAGKVYEQDVVRYYHQDGSTPIPLIDDCKVRFEITAPPDAQAVRFKNEDETAWSPWITLRPRMLSSSSSGADSFAGSLNGYFISSDTFVAPWVLSGGSGTKTVSCQVLTLKGRTPTFTIAAVARYKDLLYSVRFYRDSALTIPAGEYNGYPVISTKALTVTASDLSSIEKPIVENTTIYVKIVFSDPDRLDRVLALSALDKFDFGDLTFDVVSQGSPQTGLPLTVVPAGDSVLRGTYKGSFTVGTADGFDNVDGLAAVVVNVPNPCAASSSSSVCGDQRTPEDIQVSRQNAASGITVDLELFNQLYSRELLCSFNSLACADGTDTDVDDGHDDDTADDEPPVQGPVGCDSLSWSVSRVGEKDFFFSDPNASDWTIYSPDFQLNFSDERTDYLAFNQADLQGILVMVKPGETVSYVVTTLTSSSSSSGCDWTASSGASHSLVLTVPQKSVIFAATDNYYLHAPSAGTHGSAAKTFKVGTNTLATLAAGSTGNDGTGDIDVFTTLPLAFGKYDGAPSSSSSTPSPTTLGVITAEFATSISRNELLSKGFISLDGTLNFRLVLIPMGVGLVNIEFTCGASCFEY
jgi:hypothetical protein